MEKPRTKIKRLQHSITYAQLQIRYLNKQRNRSINQCDHILSKSVPKLKVMIKKSILQQYGQQSPMNFQPTKTLSNSKIVQKNTQYRKSILDDTSRVNMKLKQELQLIKIQDSYNLRELSKKNEQIIRQKRLKELQQKKKKKLQIRERQIKSKENIKAFHNQKKKLIKQQRKLEQMEQQNKANELQMQFRSLQQRYLYAWKVRKQANDNTSMLQRTLGSLSCAKPEQIYEMSARLGVVPDDRMKKSDAQHFLSSLSQQLHQHEKQNIC